MEQDLHRDELRLSGDDRERERERLALAQSPATVHSHMFALTRRACVPFTFLISRIGRGDLL